VRDVERIDDRGERGGRCWIVKGVMAKIGKVKPVKNGEQTSKAKAKGDSENVRKLTRVSLNTVKPLPNSDEVQTQARLARGRDSERRVLCGAAAFRGGASADDVWAIRESPGVGIEAHEHGILAENGNVSIAWRRGWTAKGLGRAMGDERGTELE